jgi:hypothetical protein
MARASKQTTAVRKMEGRERTLEEPGRQRVRLQISSERTCGLFLDMCTTGPERSMCSRLDKKSVRRKEKEGESKTSIIGLLIAGNCKE